MNQPDPSGQGGSSDELFIFARFHARDSQEATLAAVLGAQLDFARTEPGCLSIEGFRSTRDPRLFYFHSRWLDEAAFNVHAELPNTVRFLERVQPLLDQPLEVTRARPLGSAVLAMSGNAVRR